MTPAVRVLLVFGLGFILLAGLVYLADRLGLQLGRLPGDFRIVRDHFSCYFPLASSIIISILLTLLINLLARWKK